MSADNRICLMQISSGQWAVWHGSASQKYHEPPSGSDFFRTEDEASDHADKLAGEIGYVEYGIGEIDKAEQTDALCFALEDLSIRLVRLRETGSQWIVQDFDV